MSVSTNSEPTGSGAPSTPGAKREFRIYPEKTLVYRFLKSLLNMLLRVWFRPTVINRQAIPATGPVILAPVHRSVLDFAFTSLLTRRKLFFMAKAELWESRPLGWILLRLGAFPVHRESADRESVRRAQTALEGGNVLVMFPEGTRQKGPVVENLLEGVSYLAARTGAVIVPIGIANSDNALPKGAKTPKPVKVTIVVGDPISPAPGGAGRRVQRSGVHQKSEELRASIQEAFDDARRRGGIV